MERWGETDPGGQATQEDTAPPPASMDVTVAAAPEAQTHAMEVASKASTVCEQGDTVATTAPPLASAAYVPPPPEIVVAATSEKAAAPGAAPEGAKDTTADVPGCAERISPPKVAEPFTKAASVSPLRLGGADDGDGRVKFEIKAENASPGSDTSAPPAESVTPTDTTGSRPGLERVVGGDGAKDAAAKGGGCVSVG